MEQERLVEEFRSAHRVEVDQAASSGPVSYRQLPHAPHAPSLHIIGNAAVGFIHDFAARLPGNDGLGDPSPAEARSLAEQCLIAAMFGHWLLAGPAVTLDALGRACSYARIGIPGDPALHAWTYEQWQHVSIGARHAALGDTLWGLARSTWDTNRIRPVNWLVCRIRILDLMHHEGLESEIRGLLEMSRIGLFDDPLPPELAADTPLMQCWHHLLHAIVHHDVSAFDRGMAERQGLLAEHWSRGGGLAAVSLLDLGGLALLRTARRRGLQPSVVDHPYLPEDIQQT